MTNANWWARVVQARDRDDLIAQRVWTLRKDGHEAAIDLHAVPGVGAELVLLIDGELRGSRLFRADEQAELSCAIADTRATFWAMASAMTNVTRPERAGARTRTPSLREHPRDHHGVGYSYGPGTTVTLAADVHCWYEPLTSTTPACSADNTPVVEMAATTTSYTCHLTLSAETVCVVPSLSTVTAANCMVPLTAGLGVPE